MQQQKLGETRWWKTDTQTRSFRFSFLWLFAFCLGTTALLVVYGLLRGIPQGVFWPIFLGCLLWFALFSVLLVGAFPVKVSESGLQGQNCWGGACRFCWDELERVSKFNFLGLRFLRITARQGGLAMHLPVFLRDSWGFWEQVVRFAPEDNPLRAFATRTPRE